MFPCSPRDSQESSPTLQFKSINSSVLSFLYSPTLTSIHDYWKNYRQVFVGNVMSLLFNMLSSLVIAFLPRSKRLLISWLQSPSAVILEPKKIQRFRALLFKVEFTNTAALSSSEMQNAPSPAPPWAQAIRSAPRDDWRGCIPFKSGKRRVVSTDFLELLTTVDPFLQTHLAEHRYTERPLNEGWM